MLPTDAPEKVLLKDACLRARFCKCCVSVREGASPVRSPIIENQGAERHECNHPRYARFPPRAPMHLDLARAGAPGLDHDKTESVFADRRLAMISSGSPAAIEIHCH